MHAGFDLAEYRWLLLAGSVDAALVKEMFCTYILIPRECVDLEVVKKVEDGVINWREAQSDPAVRDYLMRGPRLTVSKHAPTRA